MSARIRLQSAFLALILPVLPASYAFAQDAQGQGHVATGDTAQDSSVPDASPAGNPAPADNPAPAKKTTKKKSKPKAKTSQDKVPGHKHRKPSGYDYDSSRYLSKSMESGTYRFNSDGDPLHPKASKKKKKGAVDDEDEMTAAASPSGDNSLGAAAPRRTLKKISFGEDDKKEKDKKAAAAAAAYGIPPGMIPGGAGGAGAPGGNGGSQITP